MEKLNLRLSAATRALSALEAILDEAFTVIVRDAAIQRFEYTFESMWKLLKAYLYEMEGVVCNSPKSCWRELLTMGLANETEVAQLLAMTDDRNLTSHTYVEAIAQAIYEKLPEYKRLLQRVHDRLAEEL